MEYGDRREAGLHAPPGRRKAREHLIERILDTAATAEAEGDPDDAAAFAEADTAAY